MFLLIASGHMLYMCARFRVRNLFPPAPISGLFVCAGGFDLPFISLGQGRRPRQALVWSSPGPRSGCPRPCGGDNGLVHTGITEASGMRIVEVGCLLPVLSFVRTWN